MNKILITFLLLILTIKGDFKHSKRLDRQHPNHPHVVIKQIEKEPTNPNATLGFGCSISWDGSTYELHPDQPDSPEFDAWGTFNDTLFTVGWGELHIRTNLTNRNRFAHRCHGFVEGALTGVQISQYYELWKYDVLGSRNATWPPALYEWIERNRKWTLSQAHEKAGSDPWWGEVLNIADRLEGIKLGHWYSSDEFLSSTEWWMIQAYGDMEDIMAIIEPDEVRRARRTDAWMDTHHHCTGLVYLQPDLSDVFVAQDAWSSYTGLSRMLKHYHVEGNPHAQATRSTFSSNPGVMLSVDDLWLLSSGLTVFETTVHTWNTTLYDLYCKPETVLSWIRVQVANTLAFDGKSWTAHFIRENSWTYNNQYMIIDTQRFTSGQTPRDGFLWTAEQVPGTFEVGDRTRELVERGWVPSINTPFYERVYNASGYPQKVAETKCDYWSYERCSRHLIMKRDVRTKIRSYGDFKNFMRYNDWKHDPLSNGDGAQSILSRYDLRPPECLHMGTMTQCPAPFGGLDAKTTSMARASRLIFDAISSPQYETQPAWEFGVHPWENVPYDGLPKRWQFPWTSFGPKHF